MIPPERRRLIEARRIVVKVGTAVVTRADGGLALGRVGALVEALAALRADGREVLLVTSGAIGLGAERLGFERRPTALVDRQACAAAGQGALIELYSSFFERMGLTCAQVLLTENDFRQRRQYVNLAATLQRLLALGAIPVINENDTVSAAEIALRRGRVFGDNDRLSALVASGLGCDALVLLSDVDAVYTAPPKEPGARRIAVWRDDEVRIGALSAGGRGGMQAKIEAAQLAAAGGVDAVIASGCSADTVPRVFAGHDVGTIFRHDGGTSRLRTWLPYATVPAGRLHVDEAARDRIVAERDGLDAAGLLRVEGVFDAGAVVSVVHDDEEIARCRVPDGADTLRPLAGEGQQRPIVGRDELVVLVGEEM